MSAINDALRRASNAAKSSPPTAAESQQNAGAVPPPLPPAPANIPSDVPPNNSALPPRIDLSPLPNNVAPKRSRALPVFFSMLVLVCVAGAAASYVYAKSRGPVLGKFIVTARETEEPIDAAADGEETAEPDKTGTTTVAAVTSTPVPASPSTAGKPSVPATSTSPVVKAPAVATTPTPATPATPAAPVTPAAAAPVRFPPLRLQSIFYRPTNPSVMINGKTLFVSDEIQGVTIADIKPASVTLVLSGQTNVLTLR